MTRFALALGVLMLVAYLGAGCATKPGFTVLIIPLEADGRVLWYSDTHLTPEELPAALQREHVPQDRAILLTAPPETPTTAVASVVQNLAAAGYRNVKAPR